MNNKITIIIAGSDAGNMGFNLPYAAQLVNAGFQVITFDYRGFGESSEFEFNPNNVYHPEYIVDFNTVLEWSKNNVKQDKIGVLGFSMGTIISSVGYSNSKYDFYIGEGFISSAMAIHERTKEFKDKKLVLPKSAFSDSKKIKNLDIPVLLFASKNDKITTALDCYEFSATHQLAEVIEYDGEHLRGAASLGINRYFSLITKFIEKHE